MGILLFFFAANVGASEERISIALPDGRTLPAQLRVPAGSKRTPLLPAVLLFGGFQNAARVLDLVKPDRPVVLASFDYPFTPPRRFVFPETLKYAPQAKQMIHDTVNGIGALAEFVSRHPAVDPEQIIVIGASLGAPFALAAAAESSVVRGIVLIHGFGAIPKTIAHQFERAWRPKFRELGGPVMEWLVEPFAGLLGFASWWYVGMSSPEKLAEALSPEQRVLMISAAQDSFVPAGASESLWSAIRNSRAQSERVEMPGDHLQPGAEALISDLMNKTWEWATRVKLFSATPGAPSGV